jgi:DUF971 family protein
MMQPIAPIGITVNRNTGMMVVNWNEGHTSEYPFWLLRAGCPCTECRGGHEKMSSEPDPAIFEARLQDGPSVHVQRVDQVGGYAINITWEDGHTYGIYQWAYLRKMCPCSICRNVEKQQGN